MENISAVAVEQFRATGYDVECLQAALDERDLVARIRDATVLGVRSKTPVSREVMEAAANLVAVGTFCIGVEKIDFMPKLFAPEDLAMMLRLRSAFNPMNRCSPAKMLPTAGACIEQSKVARHAAL